MTTVNFRTQKAISSTSFESRVNGKGGQGQGLIRVKQTKNNANKIPLPPTQMTGRTRTESVSSYVDSVISTSARSNRSNRSNRSSSAPRSRYSTASSVNSTSKLSTSSPKFLQWGFRNVSARLVPAEHEIPDYHQSVLLSKQNSSDSVSTLNNDSESSTSYGVRSLKSTVDTTALESKKLAMETIHSQYTLFEKEQSQYPSIPMSNGSTQRKPPLHYQQQQLHHSQKHNHHSRSHSADFIECLQKDTMLSKKLLTPPEFNDFPGSSVGVDSPIRDRAFSSPLTSPLTSPMRSPEHVSSAPMLNNGPLLNSGNNVNNNNAVNIFGSHAELEPLVRHQTEPLHMSSRYDTMKHNDTPIVMNGAGNDVNNGLQQYDLNKELRGQYDLYDGEINIQKWGSSRVSLLDLRSARSSKAVKRSIRRRLFLLLTEPQTSILSALVFGFYFIVLFASVLVMMMQTMRHFQFVPDECDFCYQKYGMSTADYAFFNENDSSSVPCEW